MPLINEIWNLQIKKGNGRLVDNKTWNCLWRWGVSWVETELSWVETETVQKNWCWRLAVLFTGFFQSPHFPIESFHPHWSSSTCLSGCSQAVMRTDPADSTQRGQNSQNELAIDGVAPAKPCPLIDGGQDGCFNTMRAISRISIESLSTIQGCLAD